MCSHIWICRLRHSNRVFRTHLTAKPNGFFTSQVLPSSWFPAHSVPASVLQPFALLTSISHPSSFPSIFVIIFLIFPLEHSYSFLLNGNTLGSPSWSDFSALTEFSLHPLIKTQQPSRHFYSFRICSKGSAHRPSSVFTHTTIRLRFPTGRVSCLSQFNNDVTLYIKEIIIRNFTLF